MKTMEGQVGMFFPASCSGRTSPDVSAATAERTSGPSWRKLRGWQNREFLFLDMSGGGGQTQELLSGTDGASLGEPTTHNIGERPSVGVASLFSPTFMGWTPRKSCLSALLEENPDPKYVLSSMACQGILRRAERRGKTKNMPEILVKALKRQAEIPPSMDSLSDSGRKT